MSKILSSIGVLILLFIVITVAYLPLVQTHFFFQDDYIWLVPNASQAQMDSSLSATFGSGRILSGYSQYKVYQYLQYLQSVGAAKAIRFVGIISISLVAYILFNIFKTNRINALYAFAASILVCTLPAFQVYASWIVLNPNINGATLSTLAALVLFKFVFKGNRSRSLHGIFAIFIAVLLFVTSLQVYQPSAMLYWSVVLIPLALLRDEDLKKKWLAPFVLYFSVGFISMALYFVSLKAVNYIMNIHPHPRGSLIALTDITGKIKWFLMSPFNNALNLWNVSPSYLLGGAVGIFIVAGVFLGMRNSMLEAINQRNYKLIWGHSQRLLLMACAIPLSLAPTLMTKESWATYRTIIALEASMCILLFMSILQIEEFLKKASMLSESFKEKIVPVLLIALTVFAVYNTHGNLNTYFAEVQSFEMEYIKDTIREYGISNLSETSKVYVIEPEKSYYLNNRWRFEFGRPSTNDGFESYIVPVAMHELGIKQKIKIIQLPADAPLVEDSNNLVIDINKLNIIFEEKYGKSQDRTGIHSR